MPPITLDRLRPKPTQRAIVVGATGTGKTTLCRVLLQKFKPVIIIDSKCTLWGSRGESRDMKWSATPENSSGFVPL